MVSGAQEWRAQFDAEVTFTNGGDLQAHGFRLDIPGRDISETALGELFTQHLGLLMVDQVRISTSVPHAVELTNKNGPGGLLLFGLEARGLSLLGSVRSAGEPWATYPSSSRR
jgi:hypothetical protein